MKHSILNLKEFVKKIFAFKTINENEKKIYQNNQIHNQYVLPFNNFANTKEEANSNVLC
jgi:hypothetical protein